MVGHFSTPITPQSGSFFHADSQLGLRRSTLSSSTTRRTLTRSNSRCAGAFPSVPPAPGQRSRLVVGAGRDHEAHCYLAVLNGPVCS